MQVLKFGGTSVANAANIAKSIDIITKAVERDRTIVVGSAISGCTDSLVKIGNLASIKDNGYKEMIDRLQEKHHEIISELLPVEKQEESQKACDDTFEYLRGIAQGVCLLGELSNTSLDAIQGCGELLSTKIIAAKLSSLGISTLWVDSRKIIRTHYERGRNRVDTDITYANVAEMIESNPVKSIFVVPGFIASDDKGRMTTLGRGGSDYSASLYAVGSQARALETWKDVPGMMTANPKIVPEAEPIHHISYRAALELSHFGAKVIYPPTIQPVVNQKIPIYVKCTFDPSAEGTLIEQNPPRGKNKLIGISNSDNIALLSLEGSGMVGVPGFSSRLFQTLSENNINIILITQASSVNTMCVAVAEKDAAKAKEATDKCFAYEISLKKLNPLKIEKGFSIVCLVGDDIFSQRGTTGRMLDALGRRSIAIRAVAQGSSERNISVIVASKDAEAAIRCIHNEFFEKSHFKEINLFVAGYGTVGKALISILAENRDKIAERTGKRIHLAGISNSRKYIIDTEGIKFQDVPSLLDKGKSAEDEAYFEELSKISMQNSIFADCTASSDIAYKYISLLKKGYGIVACNKIPFSAPYPQYKKLKETAIQNEVVLRYETTVGAALPVLESIARSVNSGDRILKIDAILSGTLNYIFSTYKGGEDGKSFADVVRYAQKSGYTEPDPRLDLSGRDVIRKLLILSREAGVALEETDINVKPLLDPGYFEGSVEDFYSKLESDEKKFVSQYKAADSKGLRQRFIASFEFDSNDSKPISGNAAIGLENVASDNPLYRLEGTDNAVIITTEFYPSPLVIQGAGAGALQTASGVINDILL
ncbi:MAG: bifunctional aspartate kinase/homoserine dehydrogenase I [Bacteroidales bacterium]|jgi:aspartokinase/homoserine dehydrogenase 1|nr:bifunctional aspartate kinase/homoserine dehydrogenase I [Bacteroidales bacterium]MCI1784922.1 bifunctional aspartate kinase/homoserine dehydrogenase I [Bacteroidales bacterium]